MERARQLQGLFFRHLRPNIPILPKPLSDSTGYRLGITIEYDSNRLLFLLPAARCKLPASSAGLDLPFLTG